MARGYRPVARDQEFLLPPNMIDWLPEDHLVWFVIEVVEQLDTTAFHANRKLGGAGRQAYDPDMLLALLIYAYASGQRSSRRIEQLCSEHVAFRVLCAQDAPDHTSIARFRAAHQDAFTGLFAQVLALCSAAGMVKVGVVSIDGSKIAANASRGANRSAESVGREVERISREVAETVVAEAVAIDAAEAPNRAVQPVAAAARAVMGCLTSSPVTVAGRPTSPKPLPNSTAAATRTRMPMPPIGRLLRSTWLASKPGARSDTDREMWTLCATTKPEFNAARTVLRRSKASQALLLPKPAAMPAPSSRPPRKPWTRSRQTSLPDISPTCAAGRPSGVTFGPDAHTPAAACQIRSTPPTPIPG